MGKPLDMLTATEIAKAHAKASAESSANCSALIAAGFGNVRGSDIRKMDHPLASDYTRISDRLEEINIEIALRKRYHGGTHRIIRKGF